MVLKGKLSFESEIKFHGDLLHDFIRHKPRDLANISPNGFKGCDLHEGEKFGDHGSVYSWHYTLVVHFIDGSAAGSSEQRVFKAVIDIDEEQKTTTFKGIEGDMFDSYLKEYKAISQVLKDDGDKHVVKLTIEYEKVKEDAPEPIAYLELLVNAVKDIESHHAMHMHAS